MYRKVKAESVPLSPELAKRFAEMPCLPGERALRPSRSAYLGVQILLGRFVGPNWATGFCKEDGVTYRLDGHHSSTVLMNLPKGAVFPEDLIATVTDYEFDTMADAPEVFDLFDNPRSARNNEDRMGIYAANVPGLSSYSRAFLVMVGNGLYEAERQRKQAKAKDAVLYSPRLRGSYFADPLRPDFLAATHWLATFLTGKNLHFLKRPVIMAQMVADWAASPALANTFWHLVFSEAHPDADHDTRQLAKFYTGQLAVAAQPKINPTKLRDRAVRAWKNFKNEVAAKGMPVEFSDVPMLPLDLPVAPDQPMAPDQPTA